MVPDKIWLDCTNATIEERPKHINVDRNKLIKRAAINTINFNAIKVETKQSSSPKKLTL
jgi:hypothetical protein